MYEPSLRLRAQAELERRRRQQSQAPPPDLWPIQYLNREKDKTYAPHHADEARFVQSDTPRYLLAKGGEGGGKSVAGIVKDLERLRRGMAGIMGSPDFEHFKKSLWPEFRRWCPRECLVEKDRYRLATEWEATKQFELHFYAEAGPVVTLYCGGFDDPAGWEGPNVSFAHFDEARRHKTAAALKVLDGRVRIPGPQGEPPQLWLTTTPRKHWLYDYFGPIQCSCPACGAIYDGDAGYQPEEFRTGPCRECGAGVVSTDERLSFKLDAYVITLLTRDNEQAGNLSPGYTLQRAQSLTEAEKRVLLEAAWEDLETAERFLPALALWDACREDLPPLNRNEPMVLAADAATGRADAPSDCFGVVGVTRHPQRRQEVAARFIRFWQAKAGQQLDFDAIETELRALIGDRARFNVVSFVYDPYQLHQMAGHLKQLVWCKEFGQQKDRLIADKQLLDLIVQHRLAHDGNTDLRRHIDNADRKNDGEGKLRLVKRSEQHKIDLAVALSMATAECLRLNLG